MRILIWLVVAGVAFEGAMLLSVYLAGRRNWAREKVDVAIVLGARVMPNGELSVVLEHRAEKALELYEAGDAEAIIACGAQGGDEPMREADAIAEYLIQHGVPGEKIFREGASTDTIENIRNSMAIMAQQGFESATVITSEYHLTRALWIARDQGLIAYGAPAAGADFFPKQFETHFRETLSWMNHWTGGLLAKISGL